MDITKWGEVVCPSNKIEKQQINKQNRALLLNCNRENTVKHGCVVCDNLAQYD